MNIYSKIKKLREEQGLSQQELANLVGFKTASAINKIESGLRDINQIKITLFAKALNTSTAYLLGDEDCEIYYPSKIEIYSDKEKQMIKKYRSLDESGKQFVDLTLDREYQRCNHVKVEKLIARGHESDKPIEVEIKSNIKPKPTDEEF